MITWPTEMEGLNLCIQENRHILVTETFLPSSLLASNQTSKSPKYLYRHTEGSFISKVPIYLDFVWFNELCIGIDIVDILVSERHPVAPVQ